MSLSDRIVESSVGISYNDNIEKAIDLIKYIIDSFEYVSIDNKCIVGIEKFGDNSIELGMRYWVPAKNYFRMQYEVNLAVYKALNNAKLTIPYPQRDVHIYGKTTI